MKKMLNIIRELVIGRIQSVKIEVELSNPLRVTSGVPQESLLSPLIFKFV